MIAELIDDPGELRAHRRTKWRDLDGDGALAGGIAEMDVRVAPMVRDAIVAAIDRSDIGYPAGDERTGVPEAFNAWARRRWGWDPDPTTVIVMPDILRGIESALLAFTEPGDGVVIQTPIYPPFLEVVAALGRRVVHNQVTTDGSLDTDGLVTMAARERPRMLLVCHPHNPTGRVFRRAELEALAAVAAEHDAVIVSDEVHADLVYSPHQFVPMATVAPARTVTLQSPSKAFNVAGLRVAVASSSAAALHEAMAALPTIHREGVGILGIEALRAAWSGDGEAWLASLLPQLAANRDRVIERLAATPLRLLAPEATYLAWLDCRGLGDASPADRFLQAGASLSDGRRFGPPGDGFVRLNFGTGPRILDGLLDRIAAACS